MIPAQQAASIAALTLFVATAAAQTQTHGQIVGEVGSDSAVVWTRASQPCLVSVLYDTNPTFATAVETPLYGAGAARDNTVRVLLTGLASDRLYYYRLRLRLQSSSPGNLGPIGRFRTAPLASQSAPISFAFSGDVQTLSEYGIFTSVAAANPAFFVMLGDFPYCDGAVTVSDYWLEHATHRASAAFQAFTNQVPVLAVWDDHEVVNNWDGATSQMLVAAGTQAFRDWWPLPNGPTDIWRQRRYGKELELFLIDTRRYRGRNDDPPSAQKPLLGATQLAWLEQALQQSDATWKVIATSVPTFYNGTDSWDGYVHEREQLLAFLRQQHVDNVVFVAADMHIAAIRELREGLLEVQAGPLAQFLGGNLRNREPEQRWHATERNFAMVHVDTSVSPSRLRIVFHDATGQVLREHVATPVATAAATLDFTSDVPEGGFRLAGPHLVRDEGRHAERARLRPGSYALHCRDLPHGAGAPASVDLQVPEGAAVRIAADYEDVPGGNPVLFAESFDAPFGPPATFTPLDLASGGSSWLVVDGALTQRTNIGDGGSPTWLGSLALAGNPAWTDVTLSARINSRDNDSCGLVFRYRDAGNFYRLRLDNERQTTQLTSFRNGTPRLLAELPGVAGYTTNAWFTLTVAAIGSHLRVLKDGVELFDVTDTDHAIGRIGLYTWADQLVAFDDVVVRAGDATGRTRNRFFAADFASGSTAGFTFVDQGATSAPSAWSVQGGALRQTSNINDGDGSRAGLPKLGTLALGGGVYGDQELHVRLRSDDDDAIGAVLRYQGPADHYRFSVDAERHYRRLVRVVGGQWTLLWEDDHDFLPGFWNELQFSALGDRLRVVWNGQTLCEVRDASIPNGRAGLYCWASTPVAFDDFVVQEPPQRRAVTVATAVGNQDALQLAAPASAGELYVLALAFSRLPGQAMAAFQAGDPRIWELTNDPLFQASLSPSPYLQNFVGVLDPDGHGDATIVFPAVVSQLLGGVELYAGGVTYDFGTNRFGELLPTVAVRVP